MELDIFGLKVSQDVVVTWLLAQGADLVAAIIILVAGWFVARVLRRVARKVMLRAKLEAILANFFANILYVIAMSVVIIAALGKLGVQTTSMVAMLGAAGLAIGLALQKSLSNFAAGLMIIFFKYFKLGDFIRGGGSEGHVVDMNIFTTSLQTLTNEKVIVPNAMLTEDVLINFTANVERRIDHIIGVSYQEDLDKVRAAITKVLEADPNILKEPAPFIGIDALADSSVNFVVRFWVAKEDYGDTKFQFLGEIKREFDAQGISIPYPQRDVHLVDSAALTVRKAAVKS